MCDLTVDLLQTMVSDLYHQGSQQMHIPCHDTNYPIVQYADDTLQVLPAIEKSLVGTESYAPHFLPNNYVACELSQNFSHPH